MSGGAYDYCYSGVEVAAETIEAQGDPLRARFAKHLYLVADALRAIEWVDSGDRGPGSEEEVIRRCLQDDYKEALIIAKNAIKNHREDHFDTWVVDTPKKWKLDQNQDGLCSSAKLVEKLEEILVKCRM